MQKAPPLLADRLEALFSAPRAAAAGDLRQLVAETVDIVAVRFPDLDMSEIRRQLARDS